MSYSSPYVIILMLVSGSVSDPRVASLQLLDSMKVPLCRSRSTDLMDSDMGRLDRKLFTDNMVGSFCTQKLFRVTFTFTCEFNRSIFSREDDSVICSKSPEDRLCPPLRCMFSRPVLPLLPRLLLLRSFASKSISFVFAPARDGSEWVGNAFLLGLSMILCHSSRSCCFLRSLPDSSGSRSSSIVDISYVL